MAKLILDEHGHFVFRCAFPERQFAKDAGLRWDANLKRWWTPDVSVAARLRVYADGKAKTKIASTTVNITPWTEPLPSAAKRLYGYQREALRFALERDKAYLRLAPGLGKTAVAACAIDALMATAVYITPPFLALNVIEEFHAWAPMLRVVELRELPSVRDFFLVDVLVVPDSQLFKERKLIRDFAKWFSKTGPVLIVDEAHRFKNLDSQRTLALFGGIKAKLGIVPGILPLFSRAYFLSGTPMPNRPMELYPVLSKVAPELIDHMGQFDFGRRYCAGYRSRFGWNFSGASNMEELQRRIVHPDGPFILKMDKDVLDLPPKIEEALIVGKDMSPRLTKLDADIGKLYGPEDVLKKQVSAGKDELHLAEYRRLLGQEKVKPAAEYIKALLEETSESLLVFAYHKDVIHGLSKALGHDGHRAPLVITGATPMAERHRIVKAFQQHPRRRLLIGNYDAMGVGFTLTKASRVLFVEYSWVPGVNDQAADRAHRIGQKKTVLVQYMVHRNSLDQKILAALLKKRTAISYV